VYAKPGKYLEPGGWQLKMRHRKRLGSLLIPIAHASWGRLIIEGVDRCQTTPVPLFGEAKQGRLLSES
jgi:hypothetical protein